MWWGTTTLQHNEWWNAMLSIMQKPSTSPKPEPITLEGKWASIGTDIEQHRCTSVFCIQAEYLQNMMVCVCSGHLPRSRGVLDIASVLPEKKMEQRYQMSRHISWPKNVDDTLIYEAARRVQLHYKYKQQTYCSLRRLTRLFQQYFCALKLKTGIYWL